MNSFLSLIKQSELEEIFRKCSPEEIVKKISFKGGLLLANRFLLNEKLDDDLREYGVFLIEKIRQRYPQEWDADWRNSVFLGDAYYFTMNYEKIYETYKQASERVSPLPQALLVSLAGCYLLINSPITIEEAEKFVLASLKIEKTIEAVTLIRGIYKTKGNEENFLYWDKILQEVKKKNIYIKDKWPQFMSGTSHLNEEDLRSLYGLIR